MTYCSSLPLHYGITSRSFRAAWAPASPPPTHLGKTEPHAEYDFYNLAAGGLDMDSDADMSNSIGHILSTLGSQLAHTKMRRTHCSVCRLSMDCSRCTPGQASPEGHGPTQTHDVDLDKMVTDYLGDPEELYQQALRLDELAAALTRVSPSPAPAAPVNDSRPLGPAPAPARPSARWAGPEGGSSILEGVLRGTLSPATRVTSPPTRPLPHCYPPGGFHGYTSGGGLAPVPTRYPCDAPVGSPVRMDCALSPVAGSQDVFSPPGPLTSPQSQSKKEAARKRKYAKRNAAEGDAPPSRGRLLHFCHICSKGFKDKYSVNVHIRTHTGEKPFQCNLCNKCFRQKAHLAKHVHIHSSPKTPPAKR
ncbi:Tissue-resident T-cell transcription regulator protein ZNF683 [Amphibalanus amphitrite]|uniref:Tissue-resident T-cell transcription regulator protein ZNF683 n=1 Tax=Amphibalanus amphitrite TaxID=1232801 RepID=A0A6A4VRJ4_AMPAM|nr:Tissue-resident T-cell transcription regulator protein ZNF683 [Amphibalanus amphitrite]